MDDGEGYDYECTACTQIVDWDGVLVLLDEDEGTCICTDCGEEEAFEDVDDDGEAECEHCGQTSDELEELEYDDWAAGSGTATMLLCPDCVDLYESTH